MTPRVSRCLPWMVGVMGALAACGGCRCGPRSSLETDSTAATNNALSAECARLVEARGEVTLERGTVIGPGAPGAIRVGDTLQTGAGAQAEVRFPDGRILVVGADARVRFLEENGGLVVDVERGVVLTRVPAEAKDAVAITLRTPFGLTRLGGELQEIEFNVGAEQSEIDVRVGTISFIGKDGNSGASAGDKLVLRQGRVELLSRTPGATPLDGAALLVVSPAGAEARKPNESRWRTVSSGDKLGEGDAIRTRSATAVLRMDGARGTWELKPNSEVVLGRVGRTAQRREASIDLKRGRLLNVPLSDEPWRVSVDAVSVDSSEGALYAIERVGPKSVAVQSALGDLALQRPDQPEARIPAGERVTVRGTTVTTAAPVKTVGLTLPSRRQQRVFGAAALSEGTLTWSGGAPEYRVKVARDPEFAKPWIEGLARGPSVTVPLPSEGALYWLVTTPAGEEVARGNASFGAEPSRTDLKLLRNDVVEGAEKTTIFYQDKPPAVTFRFRPEEGAAAYRLGIFKTADLRRPLVERTAEETDLKLESGLLSEGNYVWSVEPRASDGTVLRATGRMNKLEMVFDNAVPQLTVLSPRAGEVARVRVPVRGIAPLGSRVYINGKAAPLDDKNRFETVGFPVGSPPVIIFRVTRPGEPDAFTVRVLRQGR
ncbi:MAG: FecR domain-containing protein [Myxococcaceae bacterium]